MGASYERWHHERSEKRPLEFVEAGITGMYEMHFLNSLTPMCSGLILTNNISINRNSALALLVY